MVVAVGDIFWKTALVQREVSMSIKTIAACLVMASYLMNGDDMIPICLPFFFSALQDASIVKRNTDTPLKVTENRHKHLKQTHMRMHFSVTFHAVRTIHTLLQPWQSSPQQCGMQVLSSN